MSARILLIQNKNVMRVVSHNVVKGNGMETPTPKFGILNVSSSALAAFTSYLIKSKQIKETTMFKNINLIGAGIALLLASGAAYASNGEDHGAAVSDRMSTAGFILENGLAIPAFNAEKGRLLFGSKGCVVCHSVNGIGGEDAPEFSAEVMEHPMNAFDFAANMWRGAPAMIMMQEEELGEQIELSGDELAAIIAFVHDEEEQKLFSKADIPEEILEIMHGDED